MLFLTGALWLILGHFLHRIPTLFLLEWYGRAVFGARFSGYAYFDNWH